jgi:putative ABC transport system permease protein
MSQLTQDLTFAVRNLRKQPALMLAAILTLALGIGVNAAIFSIIDSALLTPPPFRDPERVAIVWASNAKVAKSMGLLDELPTSVAHLSYWSKAAGIESMANMSANRLVLTGLSYPQLLGVVYVSGDFFKVMGADAELGRVITPEDDPPGPATVVVISHSLWQRTFSGDPKVIGKVINLSGKPYTIIGVMPPRFVFPRGGHDVQSGYGFQAEPDAWLPLGYSLKDRQDLTYRAGVGVARLKPGASMKATEAEMKAISTRLAEISPDSDKDWGVYLQPLMEKLLGDLKPALLILWAAVSLVLLIACANVANLLLARAASRQKEIALRMAIGAGRKRLITQLLTESGLLAVLGGVLGILLAWVGLRMFEGFVPTGLTGAVTMSLNLRAVAFTALLCVVTALLAGLVPALQITRPNLAGTLREGTRAGAAAAGSGRTRNALMVAEVAVAVLLLIGAGLLVRSFVRLMNVDPGFTPEHILTAEFGLPPAVIPADQRGTYMEKILAEIKKLPGVTSAAMISDLPMGGGETLTRLRFQGQPEPKPGEAPTVAMRVVSPGYFEIMNVPLRKGRYFTPADREGTQPVVVINDVLAEEFYPGQDPIGKQVRITQGKDIWYTIVGVVAGIRYSGLQGNLRSEIYREVEQAPTGTVPFMMRIAMRTNGDPERLAGAVRAAVKNVNPGQPVSNIQTMDTLVARSIAQPRFSLLLLVLFAALALVLSIIGIYGITAYSVSQRTRELGLRMALGAQRGGLLKMVMRETGTLALIGVALGVAAAYALTRVMTSLLFEVKATDPIIFFGVSVGLILVCLLAALLPGRRATRVDPIVALRAD